MPLLKRETNFFPADLFDLSPEQQPWWVAHVQSRQEKVLARHAASHGIPFYLPQAVKTVRRSGRSFRSFVPLFPGYVFLRTPPQVRPLVLRSGVVASSINVCDQELLTRELRQLFELQRAGARMAPSDHFQPGDRVQIVDGPFRGYEGAIVREKGRVRLIIQVSTLCRVITVEFERDRVARSRSSAFARRRYTLA